MKKNETQENTNYHILNYAIDGLKLGHGVLSDIISKSSTSAKVIFSINDSLVNISLSVAQKNGIEGSLQKSAVEFYGGALGTAVCTSSTVGMGAIPAYLVCGNIGSEISGRLYDTIAKTNGYDNAEDFTQNYYNDQAEISFEDILSRYQVLDKLKDGDYTYVNSPTLGSQLYTKVDGHLQRVELPPPDPSFLDNLYVENSSVQLKTSGEDAVNIRVDSFLTENSLIPDYNVQVIGLDATTTERYAYNNSSKTYEKQAEEEKAAAEESSSASETNDPNKMIDAFKQGQEAAKALVQEMPNHLQNFQQQHGDWLASIAPSPNLAGFEQGRLLAQNLSRQGFAHTPELAQALGLGNTASHVFNPFQSFGVQTMGATTSEADTESIEDVD